MNIEVLPVTIDDKEILKNLLKKYDYEFSQYDNRDVNSIGLYGYKYLDYYWTEDKRWAFFIKVDGNLNYRLEKSCPNTEYDDGTLGDVYFFQSQHSDH